MDHSAMTPADKAKSVKKSGNWRANCKRCPTYRATNGTGSTQCIPCQQRGLYGLHVPDSTHIHEPPIIQGDIGTALINEIRDTSYHIDVVAAIRILPLTLAATMALICLAGLTQRQAAAALHISQPAIIKRLSQSAKIIIKNLPKLAKSPDSLIRLQSMVVNDNNIH